LNQEPSAEDGHRGEARPTGGGFGRTTGRRRSRGARGTVVTFSNFVLTGVLMVCLAAGVVLFWGRSTFEASGPLTQTASIVIPRGTSTASIAENLERQGIIESALVFEMNVRFANAAASLKPGEYEFQPGQSMRSVLDKIARGETVQRALLVPEGWTVSQIYARIGADPNLSGDLPPPVAEGSLMPATYPIQRGMQRAELVRRMQEAQADLVREVWSKRDTAASELRDIGQFVTLASIVEKETGKADERGRVAAVFLNRLKKGMRLQSDPTIIYAVWGGAGKPPEEPIRQSHIRNESPYNTYVARGLPPGPIACPGRAALEAVANPATTNDVYFVADGDGGHLFAATLEEHNGNVRRYREIERQRNLDVPPTLGLDDPVLAQ
jgi:UPF0755 protein